MFADIAHEKADHENGNKESTLHPDKENRGFHRRKVKAELHDFQKTGPEHHGNRQKKRIFRRYRSCHADEQCSQNRRSRARGSGKDRRDHLEESDDHRRFCIDLSNGSDPGLPARIPVLDP